MTRPDLLRVAEGAINSGRESSTNVVRGKCVRDPVVSLGRQPRLAGQGAAEKVSPSIPSSIDADLRSGMANRASITVAPGLMRRMPARPRAFAGRAACAAGSRP
jgi:hypothetical protein